MFVSRKNMIKTSEIQPVGGIDSIPFNAMRYILLSNT